MKRADDGFEDREDHQAPITLRGTDMSGAYWLAQRYDNPKPKATNFLLFNPLPPSAILKGWNHSAQGCEERATLGKWPADITTPTGL